jgi:hypothetical protein
MLKKLEDFESPSPEQSVHGLQIDLDQMEPKNLIHMKALCSEQLLTYWSCISIIVGPWMARILFE